MFCLTKSSANSQKFPHSIPWNSKPRTIKLPDWAQKSWTASRHWFFAFPNPVINNTNNTASFNPKITVTIVTSAHSGLNIQLWQKNNSVHLNVNVFICTVWFALVLPVPSSQQVERMANKQQLHKIKEICMFMQFQKFVSSCGLPSFETESSFSSSHSHH